MATVSLGYLSFVLHAHLPFVRHPHDPSPQRDDWFLEALLECYVPLLLSWHRMLKEGARFRITLSVSPTLLSMLCDEFLRDRARRHFIGLLELAEKEVDRNADNPELKPVAEMYRERFGEAKQFYVDQWDCDFPACVRPLVEQRCVELITTAATHGFLPALSPNENVVRAQILTGLQLFEEKFDRRPPGMWLPECGYYVGVDRFLESEGVRYFFVESHGLLNARPRPKYGVFAPVYCPTGVAAFARDPDAAAQVWSSILGYPGDVDYREFYRDIGYELDPKYLQPYLPADATRKDTGFKYYRVTGRGEQKRPYVRNWAVDKAGLHAGHFLDTNMARVEYLSGVLDRKPILVAPFDAELFGHWWFEGPEWLDFVMRKIVHDQDKIELITPGDYLDRYPTNQAVDLSASTWGRKGYSDVWVNQRNDYVYRHLSWAARRISEVAGAPSPRRTWRHRAEVQAARELLLAQSSDWTFMMDDANTAAYGHSRFREHMLNFIGLYRQLRAERIDRRWLQELEDKDNLFANLNLANFR